LLLDYPNGKSKSLSYFSPKRGSAIADRADDRERQRLRRLGLIAYCGRPHRWQISSLGLAVRRHLEQNNG
jgi:hypothetical protein